MVKIGPPPQNRQEGGLLRVGEGVPQGSLLFLYTCGFQPILGWGADFDHIEILTILRVGEGGPLRVREGGPPRVVGGPDRPENFLADFP